MWKYCFNHGLQRCKYKRTKVIPGSSRFRTCYSSQNDDAVFPLRPSPHPADPFFCPLLTPTFVYYPLQYTFYWALCCWNAASCLFFFLILNYLKFIVCYGVYSNVFLSVFSPIPSPPWTHLRRLEKCLNTHTAACSSCLFTGLRETECVSFFKKPIDRTDYSEILFLLYYSVFCFSLVSFKKFQQQSCYPVGTMDCKWLELCIPSQL